jgi:hypothetical protein
MCSSLPPAVELRRRARLCGLGLLLWASAAGSGAAQTIAYQQESPGVSYGHLAKAQGPLSIHVLKFDYHRPELKLATSLGQGTIFGLASVRKEMAALPAAAGQPLAAVNGDFFVMKKDPYQGDPRGLQLLNGELVSSPDKGPCFWMDPAGGPRVAVVRSHCKVLWPHGTETPIRINEPPGPEGAVLLTPRLGASTRATNGLELVLEARSHGPWLPLQANQTYSARVREVRTNGNTALSPEIMVLSLGPRLATQFSSIQVGATLKIMTALTPDLKGVQTAIGGGPALVARGQSLYRNVKGKAAARSIDRNPRTAIGWNKTDFFFVVVDGRQKDLSIGVGFPELADIMLEVGCQEALNLDGGGSSTLWLKGNVVNHPSEKGVERNVANALVLLRK